MDLNETSTMDDLLLPREELEDIDFHLLAYCPNLDFPKSLSRGDPASNQTSISYVITDKLFPPYIRNHINAESPSEATFNELGDPNFTDSGFVSISKSRKLLMGKLKGYCAEEGKKSTWIPGKDNSGWRMCMIDGNMLVVNHAKVLKLSDVLESMGEVMSDDKKKVGEY